MEVNFYMPVKVISGKDAVLKNGEIIKSFGKKCLIVTSKTSGRLSGALGDITKVLKEYNIEHEVYDGISQNPLLSSCFECAKQTRDFGAEFLIGIGGGSPLDATKAIAIYAANENLEVMDIYKRVYDNTPLPMILIGTTAGTGSEVSAVSVLTVDETKMKRSIAGEDCYAKLSFADSKYTHSVPYDTTVSTALDAMAHAIEGFFTPKYSDILSMFGEKGIPMIWEGLCYLYENENMMPDEKIREKLYYGSIYAGFILNTCGTAFPHPLGYILTENHNIPHGKACAYFMPDFLERAKKYEKEKYDAWFKMLNVTDEQFIKVIKKLTNVEKIDFTHEDAKNHTKRWDRPKNFTVTPGGLTNEDVIKILTK